MQIKKLIKKKINIGIIGGKLQGVEAAYLSKKAKCNITVIDKNKNCFAKIFANRTFIFDITKHLKKYLRIANKMDYLLPANENMKTLNFIEFNKKKVKCKILFDFKAYQISHNKKISKEVFKKLNLLTPKEKPENPPYIIKPIDKSGSEGVQLIKNTMEKNILNNYLIEQYIEGPIISLEVIGNKNNYKIGIETRIHIDNKYDCYKVTPLEINKQYREMGLKIAKYLNLNGIMDIEAIENENGIFILEIDARFPSQTPICVYHSSGINLIKEMFTKIKNEVKKENVIKNYCIV